jgi:mono/diheme cytochrome c family protein
MKCNALLLTGALLCLVSGARADDPGDQAKIDAGATVYAYHCATCHGDDLVHTGDTTFDLGKLHANERPRFDNSVRNGKNQMPPWKGVLTDDEIDQLWHYIRANAYDKDQ